MSEGDQGQAAGTRPEFRPGRGLSIFQPLRIPQYRRYMVAFLGSGVAFQTSQVALGWQTFDLTGDAGALGAVLFVFGIAIVVGSLIGGVAADRYSRATIIISMQALNGVMVVGLAVAVVLDAAALWHMYGMAAIAGATQAGHLPARQAFIFNIVGRPFLASALALNTSVMNVLRLGAPAIAGVLIGFVGVETVWFVAAGGADGFGVYHAVRGRPEHSGVFRREPLAAALPGGRVRLPEVQQNVADACLDDTRNRHDRIPVPRPDASLRL